MTQQFKFGDKVKFINQPTNKEFIFINQDDKWVIIVDEASNMHEAWDTDITHIEPQNQQSAWVSVKDALPSNGTDCLVWREPKNDDYGSCGYIFSTFEDGKFDDIYAWEEVTHWQPLPEPPKTQGVVHVIG